jgi:hypothetical protein
MRTGWLRSDEEETNVSAGDEQELWAEGGEMSWKKRRWDREEEKIG